MSNFRNPLLGTAFVDALFTKGDPEKRADVENAPKILSNEPLKSALTWVCCMCAFEDRPMIRGKNACLIVDMQPVCVECGHVECGLCYRALCSQMYTIFADGNCRVHFAVDDAPAFGCYEEATLEGSMPAPLGMPEMRRSSRIAGALGSADAVGFLGGETETRTAEASCTPAKRKTKRKVANKQQSPLKSALSNGGTEAKTPKSNRPKKSVRISSDQTTLKTKLLLSAQSETGDISKADGPCPVGSHVDTSAKVYDV